MRGAARSREIGRAMIPVEVGRAAARPPGDDRPRSTYLLAFAIRKFLKRFPGQPAHARLQVRDGDAFGILEII